MSDEIKASPKERIRQHVMQLSQETLIHPVPLDNLDTNIVSKLLADMASAHHLDGATAPGSPPLFLFRLPENVPPSSLKSDELLFLPWSWPGPFGAAFTLTVSARAFPFLSRISLNQAAEAFKDFKDGRCMAIFATKKKPVAAFEVKLAATTFTQENFNKHWNTVATNAAQLHDPAAEFWNAVASNGSLEKYLTIHDQLACSWVRAFKTISRYAQEALEEFCGSSILQEYRTANLPLTVVNFFEAADKAQKNLNLVFDYFTRSLEQEGWVATFLMDLGVTVDRYQQWGAPIYAPGLLFAAYLHTSKLTRSGLALPWIDGTERRIKHLLLEPDQFGSETLVEDYWARLPSSYFIDWGELITGRDIHISPHEEKNGWVNVQLGADILATESSIQALLEEAVANRKWSIPPHAIVELKFGPFAFCEIVDMGHEVYFILRDPQWRFCVASVNPQKQAWAIQVWPEEPGARQEEINSAVKLLLAAILRDFLVVEERERIFTPSTLPKRIAQRIRSEESTRIVYLPRVQYKSPPNLERCSETLAHEARRQHFVSAHLRRAEVSSKYQLLLAQIYGFPVPSGYTFVRPHERGHKKVEVLYRSRSALLSLYTIKDSTQQGKIQWFQFERDVSALMERLGYEVQHVAASGRGDHGVDVYATKFVNDVFENWIIQCKCYSPHNKVGPKIVRELIGSLTRYKTGTKGMVVTTSTFTPGAVEEANRVGVKLINGDSFLKLINN